MFESTFDNLSYLNFSSTIKNKQSPLKKIYKNIKEDILEENIEKKENMNNLKEKNYFKENFLHQKIRILQNTLQNMDYPIIGNLYSNDEIEIEKTINLFFFIFYIGLIFF